MVEVLDGLVELEALDADELDEELDVLLDGDEELVDVVADDAELEELVLDADELVLEDDEVDELDEVVFEDDVFEPVEGYRPNPVPTAERDI